MNRSTSTHVGPAGGQALRTNWAETAFAKVPSGQTAGAFTMTELVAERGWARPR